MIACFRVPPLARPQDRMELFLDYLQALPGAGALTAVALRFPDQYPSLREVDGLSDTAFRLHVSAFFWCSLNRTDGLIRQEDLGLVCARVRAPERFAAECERRGAWHEARHDCGSEHCAGPVDADGWVVHDYLRENPSAAELDAAESGKSRGGKWGNHKRWHEDKGKMAPGCEFCEAAKSRRVPARKPPPKRTSDNRSVSDRITDSHPTPISRSKDLDIDLDLKPDDQVSQSGVVNARRRGREPAPGTPEFRRQVIDAFTEKTTVRIGDAEADALAAEVLGKATGAVPHKLGYVLKAIADEDKPAGRWVPSLRATPAPAKTGLPGWCRECDEISRMVEVVIDGKLHLDHCPNCSRQAAALGVAI